MRRGKRARDVLDEQKQQQEEQNEEKDTNNNTASASSKTRSRSRIVAGKIKFSSKKIINGPITTPTPQAMKSSTQQRGELSSISTNNTTPPAELRVLSTAHAIAIAIEHLKKEDSKLRSVIEMHDAPTFQKCHSAFQALVRSIVYQQLATKAASCIYNRLVSLFQDETQFTPENLTGLTPSELRKIGISERKASYIHDLASKFTSGFLSDSVIFNMDDEKLISSLTSVKGIGVWSVHMFMIFSLHRPDVLPVGDLGVRKGFQMLYGLKQLPTPSQMEALSESWMPYRSIGSWYMWRLIETKGAIFTSE